MASLTMPLKTNSNDFGVFWNYLADTNSFVVVAIFFEGFDFLVSITCKETVNVHVLWPLCAHAVPFRMLWCP